MIKKYLIPLLILFPIISYGQEHGFPFGKVTYAELDMKAYDKDTSAVAVIVNEFGEAYISNNDQHNLVFEYHAKIKILKKNGLDKANFAIPLYRKDQRVELLRSIQASSFRIENGTIQEQKLSPKNIFTEKRNENWEIKKIAVPNVQVGSIVEIMYVLESPFFYNFRPWKFQSDIPKVYSEYWATIPANYNYNIKLKGFLNLSKNESELIENCFMPGGNKADCGRMKFGMKDIPAFVEEEFMTASHNFISAINFELSEVKYFNGSVDKITKEWKDVEDELRKNPKFGVQLRRGKDIIDTSKELMIQSEKDSLEKAKKIYEFIKTSYKWNQDFDAFCENGIKKAYESKTGNVGDINLSLIAAFRHAGLNANPLILSTRENGFVTELYPVLSDFNYVIAWLKVNGTVYLVDATDPYLPFGVIPVHCLNGKGRVIGDKTSYWYEIKPPAKLHEGHFLTLKIEGDGYFRGTIKNTYQGYSGVKHRKKINSYSDQSHYVMEKEKELKKINIESVKFENLDAIDKQLYETWEVEIEGFSNLNANMLFLNPYILEKWDQNPFKSSERLYPVDFATPMEKTITIILEYPAGFEVEELPENMVIALPNKGGRFTFNAQNLGNKLSITNRLVISNTVYTSEEYHYLKELFSRIVQLQNTDIIFKRK